MSTSGPSSPLVYLSYGLVQVCEIDLSHMSKNNGNSDLVCEKIVVCSLICFCILVAYVANNLDPDQMATLGAA